MTSLTNDIMASATAITIALLFSGCTLGPDFQRPISPDVNSYTAKKTAAQISPEPSSGAIQYLASGKDIPGQWWTLFRSPQLNSLIEQGLKHSPDLQAAQAALTEAQENTIAKQGSLFPALDASLSDTRQKTSGAMFGNPDGGGSLFTLYNASVQISYTLDVFGAIRRQIESLDAQTDYQRFQLEGVFLTLAGNIVTTAIQEAALRGQISATEEMITAQTRQLDVIKQQVELGSAAQTAVLAQQSALEQTRTNLPTLQQQLAQTRHRLTVLTGSFPKNETAAQFKLSDLHLPEQLPLSLPAKLVEQRPDIRAQENVLHAASAQIGVVTASIFPDFTISAHAGSIATKAGDLFIPGSYIWSAGANILQPLFHGGEFTHKRLAAIAAYEQAAAQYKSTVLQAFQNVADTLSALEFDVEELTAQERAKQAAFDSLELMRAQFGIGSVSYLELLNSEHDYHQAQIGQIKAEATRLADTAALFQSLGGGWWNRADLSRVMTAEKEKSKPKPSLHQDIACFLHACLDNEKLFDNSTPKQEVNK
ncbi:MAG: efflux transporter outer membrane subunit [Methylococcaceae bacterium]